MKIKSVLVIISLTSATLLAGCQSVVAPHRATTAFYKDQVDATTQVSKSINTVAAAIAPDSSDVKKRVDQIEQENNRLKADIAKAREAADEANQKLKEKIGEVAGDFVKVAGAFSGTGPYVGILTGFVSDIAKNKADAAGKKVSDDQGEALAKLKETLSANIDQRIKLTSDQQVKLQDEIASIGKERGLSEQQIAAIQAQAGKGDLSGLLLSGGSAGVVGLLALLRTLGGSRSQPQIEQQGEAIAQQTDQVAANKKQLDELYDREREHQATLSQMLGVQQDLKKQVDELYDRDRDQQAVIAAQQSRLTKLGV